MAILQHLLDANRRETSSKKKNIFLRSCVCDQRAVVLNALKSDDGDFEFQVSSCLERGIKTKSRRTCIKLNEHLPARLEQCPWSLVYSTQRHGISLGTLYKSMGGMDCSTSTLTVIRDNCGQVRRSGGLLLA